MKNRHLLPSISLAFTAFALPAFAADAYVVDAAAGPGSDFTSVEDALAAVPAGSTLVLRPGLYQEGATFLNDTSITITAAADGVRIQTQFIIQNLSAGSRVTVSGMQIEPLGAMAEILQIFDNAGTVWFENCEIVPPGSVTLFSGPDTVLVTNSSDVVFKGCEITGSTPYGDIAQGGAGLIANDSSVYLYDSVVTGGFGTSNFTTDFQGEGGVGFELNGGLLFASGSTISGGKGGQAGSVFGCIGQTGGTGGVGLRVQGTTPLAVVLDTALVGGPGGDVTGAGDCETGASGPRSDVQSGQLLDLLGVTRTFSVASPVTAGTSAAATITGGPGEFAWYTLSETAAPFAVPEFLGVFHLGLPFSAFVAGPLDGTGTLDFSIPTSLPPSVSGMTLHLQALHVQGPGVLRLGPPAMLVVVAPGVG